MALTGFPIEEGYGMTETGLATNNPPSGPNKPGSVGRPMPGFSLAVRDEDGAEVPTGSEGRVWVRSRNFAAGGRGRRARTPGPGGCRCGGGTQSPAR